MTNLDQYPDQSGPIFFDQSGPIPILILYWVCRWHVRPIFNRDWSFFQTNLKIYFFQYRILRVGIGPRSGPDCTVEPRSIPDCTVGPRRAPIAPSGPDQARLHRRAPIGPRLRRVSDKFVKTLFGIVLGGSTIA